QDVAPTLDLDVSKLNWKSFLEGAENWVDGTTMRQRAVVLKGNYGLSDVPKFLAQQAKIPADVQYIVLTGTVLRGPGGGLRVPYLYRYGVRWVLSFCWLGGDWDSDGRVACSE
ncbi:MAG: hypothetical protein WCV83_04400, partial [Candidatus Magasanikbacteria bacterium]